MLWGRLRGLWNFLEPRGRSGSSRVKLGLKKKYIHTLRQKRLHDVKHRFNGIDHSNDSHFSGNGFRVR
jgi:hypothetical protein